ncbi:MAG: hypothetical protein GY791_01150 [Alphaproteobacteria bacterium]|nr:hypothetical protein [Alphaproteobacteria bacterium]
MSEMAANSKFRYGACGQLREAGLKIVHEPGPMKHGTRVVAFFEDPDAFKVELNESASK